MKTTRILPFAALIVTAAVHGQGSLTPPPGAPAPVMKSLDQVEARTPLVAGQPGVSIDANGTITISQPGSYYLTGNLTITTAGASGIVISSSNVSLDLNGFSLICTQANGGAAINYGSNKSISIRNGIVAGGTTQSGGTFTLAGWGYGVNSSQPAGGPVRVSDLIVRGVRSRGLFLGTSNGCVAERCIVDTCGEMGISAHTVRDCVVLAANSDGIWTGNSPNGGLVSNCHSESVGLSFAMGIDASGAMVTNSRGSSASSVGILALEARDSYGSSSASIGMSVTQGATGCTGISTAVSGTHDGIEVEGIATNCNGSSSSGGEGVNAVTATGCQGSSASGIGLKATVAMNCRGTSVSGIGLNATLATGCVGHRLSGTAIQAVTANGCHASAGTVTATNKYNMP